MSGSRSKPSSADAEPDLATLLRILWRRRRWIALPLALALVLALAVLWFAPPLYRAEATVAVGPAAGTGLVPGAPAGPAPDDREIDSLARLLAADPVRRAAIRRLRAAGAIAPGEELPEPEVIRRTRTRLLVVRVTHGDPELAAAYADALVEAFLAERRNRLEAAVREGTAVLRAELAGLREERGRLEARLARLVATRLGPEGGALAARPERLAVLEGELVRVRAERAALQAEIATLERSAGNAAPATDGAALERLIAMRAELERRRAELAGEYGPRHPEVRRLQREIAALDAGIAGEGRRLVARRRAGLASLREREARLAAELARLRERAAEQERLAGELEGLRARLSDLVARERELERRLGEARTRIRLAAPALEWVERAEAPDEPVFPRPVPVFAFALFGGGGLGLLLVAACELLGRTVRDPAAIARTFAAPVVEIPRTVGRRAVRVDLADVPLDLPGSPPDRALGALLARLGPSRSPPGRVVALVHARAQDAGPIGLALARHAALAGLASAFVDAGSGGVELRRRLGLPGGPGWPEVLERGLDPLPLLCEDPLSPLRILPGAAGAGERDPVEDPERAQGVFERLRARVALVVVELAIAHGGVDAVPFLRAADLVVPVVRVGRTPEEAARALAALLEGGAGRPAAVVLLDAQPEAGRARPAAGPGMGVSAWRALRGPRCFRKTFL